MNRPFALKWQQQIQIMFPNQPNYACHSKKNLSWFNRNMNQKFLLKKLTNEVSNKIGQLFIASYKH